MQRRARALHSRWLALAGALVVVAASLIYWVRPYYDPQFNDAALYVLSAESMLSGDGYSHLGSPITTRPPGYAVLLLPVVALAGIDFLALNLWANMLGIAALALLYHYVLPRLGALVSSAVCLALWLNPLFVLLCNTTMSDVPGLALLLGCLLLERRARVEDSMGWDAALGVLLAVALYVRTALVVLAPAILLSRLLQRDDPDEPAGQVTRRLVRQAVPILVLPALLLAPWSLRNAAVGPAAVSDEVWLQSYSTAMLHVEPGDPDSPRLSWRAIATRPVEQLSLALPVLGNRLQSESAGLGVWLVTLCALGCFAFVLVRRRSAGELSALAQLVVVGFYFAYQARLLLPVYLFVFTAVVEVVLLASRRLLGRRGWAAGATAALVLLLAAVDFEPRRAPALRERHEALASTAELVDRELPPDIPVAVRTGVHLSLFLDRPVHSVDPALRREGRSGARRTLEKNRVGAVLLPPRGLTRRLLAELVEEHGVDGCTVVSGATGRDARAPNPNSTLWLLRLDGSAATGGERCDPRAVARDRS